MPKRDKLTTFKNRHKDLTTALDAATNIEVIKGCLKELRGQYNALMDSYRGALADCIEYERENKALKAEIERRDGKATSGEREDWSSWVLMVSRLSFCQW
jgi:hypothetical protein